VKASAEADDFASEGEGARMEGRRKNSTIDSSLGEAKRAAKDEGTNLPISVATEHTSL